MKRFDTDQPRVAFVLGQNADGGTELQARTLIKELAARGAHVDVFLVDGQSGTRGLPSATVVLSNGRPGGVWSVFAYVAMAAQLHRQLRSGKYLAVHSAMARGYVLSALATVGVPSTRHISWRRNQGVHLKGTNLRFSRVLERFALWRSDLIVSNSTDVSLYWRELAGGQESKHVVIPNILEPWRFEDVPPVMPPAGVLRIVSVGGLKPEKGHRLLVEAIAESPMLRQRIEVLLVGDGGEHASLARQAAEAGVSLVLAGAVEDPRPWLHAADLYVHPSLSEGSSNAVAEAMAAGLPIVATRVGGMTDLVGRAGILVEPGSSGALAEEISRLLDDPVEREEMGKAARTRALDRFQPDQVVNEYLRVYGVSGICAE